MTGDRVESPRGSDGERLFYFVILAIPVLAYFPLEWIKTVAPPRSAMWYFTERARFVVLLAPVSFVFMLVACARWLPTGARHRWVALALVVLTGYFVVRTLLLVLMVS